MDAEIEIGPVKVEQEHCVPTYVNKLKEVSIFHPKCLPVARLKTLKTPRWHLSCSRLLETRRVPHDHHVQWYNSRVPYSERSMDDSLESEKRKFRKPEEKVFRVTSCE
jgi:hypothetical protein